MYVAGKTIVKKYNFAFKYAIKQAKFILDRYNISKS